MSSQRRIVAIIQARMSSSRLPGKVLADLAGSPLLSRVIRRVKAARRLDEVIVATSTDRTDDPIEQLCRGEGVRCFRGPLNDVLERYRLAAAWAHADIVVRVTADCPLIDPEIVDAVVERFHLDDDDYVTNTMPYGGPEGLDVEVFPASLLDRIADQAVSPEDREHVTAFVRRSGDFRRRNIDLDLVGSGSHWSVDRAEDLAFVRRIYTAMAERGDPEHFGARDVLRYLSEERSSGRGGRLRLRRARSADARLLFGWANDPAVRARSFHPDPIPWTEHERWLEARLADPATAIWIMEAGGQPVGQVRYERKGDAAEVGITIEGGSRGQGFGQEILRRSATAACGSLGVSRLVALVMADNAASIRAFLGAGYDQVGTEMAYGQVVHRFERRCQSDPKERLPRSARPLERPRPIGGTTRAGR